MDDRKRAIDRIRKLRALAQDAAVTEEEAASYAQKMQKELLRHGLSEDDLVVTREGSPGYARFCWTMKYSCTWRRQLATTIGEFCGVVLLFTPGTDEAFFIGREESCEAALEMYWMLEGACRSIPRTVYKERKIQRRAEKGVALGLMMRLKKIMASLPKSNLPVVYEHQRVANWLDEINGEPLRVSDSQTELDTPEARAGFMASRSVRIQDEVK